MIYFDILFCVLVVVGGVLVKLARKSFNEAEELFAQSGEILKECREIQDAWSNNKGVNLLLEACRNYIPSTEPLHGHITDIVGWCGCGHCEDVPLEKVVDEH